MSDKSKIDLHAKPVSDLRSGWTTGACATAAATAALRALLEGKFTPTVTIMLPRDNTPTFVLSRHLIEGDAATAGVIKDAGDDPDITHEAEIIVTIAPNKPGDGLTFHAGHGVGTVTLPGLVLAVGEPAINPAPRKMIEDNMAAVARQFAAPLDYAVTIAIPGGEQLAEKTMNGRLGIKGGLSVLGTTGVVKPYSCAAWINSIHSGIDVGRAAGIRHLAGATGKTSEAAVQAYYNLPELALIDMGDFAGGMLKHLRRHPVPRVTIAGGFAKITKLGQGAMDLHSSRSALDFKKLAATLADLGASSEAVATAINANTALQVLELARQLGLPLADRIAAQAREVAMATLSGETEIDILVFDRQGKLAGKTDIVR